VENGSAHFYCLLTTVYSLLMTMPTYEYKCFACNHAFEKFQSITAEPIKKCPECGKLKVRRLLGTGAGLIFKGSGFYITDYRSEGYKDAAKKAEGSPSSGGDAKPAEAGASTSTEAKPEAKPAAKTDAAPASAPKTEPKASKSAKKK
jgi:putative FmdB family regulatory protein